MSKNNKHIGETRMMNCGMEATIIEWFCYNNITVKFADGTVAKNKSYGAFKKGFIKNPYYLINMRLNETKIMNCGMKATIIRYYNAENIDVQFEDGTIIKNRTYGCFKNGNINNKNISRKKVNRIGQRGIMNNGMEAIIINYREITDIDIQFNDGTIVKNKKYTNFLKGEIENPNFKNTNHTSKPESILLYYLEPYGFKHYKNMKNIGEIDCYNPELKIAIEYDGAYWHKNKKDIDIKKNIACKNAGITMIRIRELPCEDLDNTCIVFNYKPKHNYFCIEFNNCLKEVFNYLNNINNEIKIHANIIKDKDKIIKKYFKDKNYQAERIGEVNIAVNGQKMTILNYRGYEDIDVIFEDGTIVKNKYYNNFKDGKIKNPNYYLNTRIGMTNTNISGYRMTIIEYFSSMNITVQFEDGIIVKNRTYSNFLKGMIKKPNSLR